MTFVLYGIFVVVQLFLRERRERLATLLRFPLSLVFSRLLNLCSACIPYQGGGPQPAVQFRPNRNIPKAISAGK